MFQKGLSSNGMQRFTRKSGRIPPSRNNSNCFTHAEIGDSSACKRGVIPEPRRRRGTSHFLMDHAGDWLYAMSDGVRSLAPLGMTVDHCVRFKIIFVAAGRSSATQFAVLQLASQSSPV